MKPFLPVGEVPRLKKLPLVAACRLRPKWTETRVRRQVNETVKIGQGVRLDARGTGLLSRRSGLPERCAEQDPPARLRKTMQYLQCLRLITVGMVRPDAQHNIDCGSLGLCDTLDEADSIVEASCGRVPPSAL